MPGLADSLGLGGPFVMMICFMEAYLHTATEYWPVWTGRWAFVLSVKGMTMSTTVPAEFLHKRWDRLPFCLGFPFCLLCLLLEDLDAICLDMLLGQSPLLDQRAIISQERGPLAVSVVCTIGWY